MEPRASAAAANDGARVTQSDAAVFQQPKQSQQQVAAAFNGSVRTGFSSTPAPAPADSTQASAASTNAERQTLPSAANALPQPRTGYATGSVTRMTVSVVKKGNRLGFGVRHDQAKRFVVSTVVGRSALHEGDTLVSVNGVLLDGLDFLAVVEQLKAMPPGTLVFDIERPAVAPRRPAAKTTNCSSASPPPPVSSAATSVPAAGASAAAAVRAVPTMNGNTMAGGGPAVVSAAIPPTTVATLVSAPSTGLVVGAEPKALPSAVTNTSGIPAPITLSSVAAPTQPPAPSSSPQAPMLPGQPPLKKPRISAVSEPATAITSSTLNNNVVINGGVPHVVPTGTPATANPAEKKPPTVNALMKELGRQRAEKASLENKSAALRKRLQQMLIDCDEVRVRARAEVQAVKDKAQRDVEEAQQALAAARAQLRLADRAPDVGRADSIAYELEAARTQLERLKKADSERTALLNARYSMENRLAEREAHRLLDALIADGCAQLRVIARRHAASNSTASGSGAVGGAADDTNMVTVAREGVRRLAFLKLFGLPHDFLHYMSPSYQSLDVLRHEVGREQLADLFGSALRHEERAGLFYVAAGPMDVTFDPRTETLALKCGWAEQNAIRELARNFRF